MLVCPITASCSRLALFSFRSRVTHLLLSRHASGAPHSPNIHKWHVPVSTKRIYTVEETLHYLHAQLLANNPPPPFSMFIKLLQCADTNAQADEILALAQENGYGDRTALYNTKMAYHFFKRDFALLFETRDLMRRNEVMLDYTTYCLCIKAYCGQEKIKSAIECLAELEQLKSVSVTLDANAYLPFMEFYVARNNVSEVVSVYEAMKQKAITPSHDCYAMLLHAAAPGGLVSLNSVINQMQEIDKVPIGEAVISHYVDITLHMNKLAAAESMVQKGFDEYMLLPRIRTLTRLTSFYAKQKMMDKIFSLFQKIVQIGYIPDAAYLHFLIGCFRQKEYHNQIVQIHNFITEKAIPLDQKCYINLIKHYAAAGAPQLMTAIFKEMKAIFPITPPIYSALVKGYAMSDMIDDAEAVWKLCNEMKLQLSFPAYILLVEAYYKRYNLVLAKKALNEATQFYGHINKENDIITKMWQRFNKM